MTVIKGSCLCKKIQYQITQEPFDCLYCHCSICRKLSGSIGVAYGAILKNHFTWQAGENLITTFKPTNDTTRYFCSTCCTFLLSEHIEDARYFYVSLGCIDTESNITVKYHQFIADKPNWVYLNNNLPHFLEWPNDEHLA